MRALVHDPFQGTLGATGASLRLKGTAEMSQFSCRILLTLAACSGLACGCAGDQKEAETPAGEAADQAPVMKTTPSPGEESEPAPNGPPAGLPQAEPQSSSGTQNNVLAAPTLEPARESLSEGQIARIAELVNTAEIDQGKVAQTKAKFPRVKAFAAKMVQHHGHAKAEQAKLASRLNIRVADSSEAAALKTEGEATLTTLKSTPAADFDVAYIDSQVTGHQKVLAAIDGQLLPSAKTDTVVSALKMGRDAVAAHLEEAKAIQAELAKASSK
ncbi:MAG: uncharacterized protein K0R38_540 [Polyangiaceae bacterium]|nr:uncharacterized protein [Polyangiaceae bacterium]